MSDETANANPADKKLAMPMIILIVGSMVLALLIVSAAIRWMPTKASTFAPQVDALYYFIYWVSVFFTLLIAGTLVFFLLYYKQTDKAAPAPGKATHSTALELTWTIIPVFIVLAIFAFGFKGYMNMAVAPSGSYEIVVIARQWGWQFLYPNGYADDHLHIPADRNIKLILQSEDVIHSLYIKQFRAKKDVVPGRFNEMWFRSHWDEERVKDRKTAAELEMGDKIETVLAYDLYCTEYCGQSHSQMNRKVYVHKNSYAFDLWLADASFIPGRFTPLERGKNLWQNLCSTCHTIDGSSGTGPTWQNLYGTQREMTTGEMILADENYLRESILYPQKQIRKGYESQNMAAFSTLPDLDIFALTQYIKSLSDDHEGSDEWGKYAVKAGEEAEDGAEEQDGGEATP